VPVARLRAIQLKHWKRPATMYRELKALGAGETVARRVAGNNQPLSAVTANRRKQIHSFFCEFLFKFLAHGPTHFATRKSALKFL